MNEFLRAPILGSEPKVILDVASWEGEYWESV